MSTTSTTPRSSALARGPLGRWRSLDLVTAAVLGVAFGVVFWGWDVVYNVLSPGFGFFQPAKGLLGGVWLLPAVVGALVVRRPGAALFTELVAASVEYLLGSGWSVGVLISGGLQGLGVEIAVALFAWRRWGAGVAALGGALAAALEALYEAFAYNDWVLGWDLAYGAAFVVSGAVVAGLGGAALVRALARAGALQRFPAGAEHRAAQRA
ncbi:ECF transporter S component [Kineococcus rubinsiae]|uniref:ECF transporter S component n=1 Tax=Kineococcus rubinsiae TaxID=2609562 RepID=UPI00142F79A5|nr:ECF transporter S component [Kineococcus rubinsiae]NIZ93436.1 ABC transporter permease [Kineococcus rubinsiae]